MPILNAQGSVAEKNINGWIEATNQDIESKIAEDLWSFIAPFSSIFYISVQLICVIPRDWAQKAPFCQYLSKS